jgi:hypothetical protein
MIRGRPFDLSIHVRVMKKKGGGGKAIILFLMPVKIINLILLIEKINNLAFM